MNPESFYEYKVRIYAEDVDFMGIVYHANYLRYCERSRTEILRQNNLLLGELIKQDTMFAISKLTMHYLAPARLDDMLTIRTTMHESGVCSFVFEHEIKNQHEKALCNAQIKVVCVNENLKPKKFMY